jgi:hypothetical protein
MALTSITVIPMSVFVSNDAVKALNIKKMDVGKVIVAHKGILISLEEKSIVTTIVNTKM